MLFCNSGNKALKLGFCTDMLALASLTSDWMNDIHIYKEVSLLARIWTQVPRPTGKLQKLLIPFGHFATYIIFKSMQQNIK